MTQTVQPLLVELFTEELPPKVLRQLGQAFADGIQAGLAQRGLLADDNTVTAFASPRRLAVRLSSVRDQAPDAPYVEKLMPVGVGLTADGQAAPSLLKKLAAKGLQHVDVADLAREGEGKAETLVYRGIAEGASLQTGLQAALDTALTSLPIPKVMGYQLADGETTVRFVRPAHGLVALFGETVVPVTALGLTAGRTTFGHRFQCSGELSIADAGSYETTMSGQGNVIAGFDERRAIIEGQLRSKAAELGA